ncbi:permease YjgP/YjgQ family protein [Geobacter metallireducens RCH3]|nr:permease YjgP/YjgQ family protein [Geobacter metallireducens RCH3]
MNRQLTRANCDAHPSVIYNPHTFVYHRASMTSILFRYIFKETAVPFVLGMAVFTFVLLMGRLLKLAEMVFAKGVPFLDVCRLILYMLPSFLLVAIPMAFLLAVLLSFGRLSADSEVTAMKAGGLASDRCSRQSSRSPSLPISSRRSSRSLHSPGATLPSSDFSTRLLSRGLPQPSRKRYLSTISPAWLCILTIMTRRATRYRAS